MEVHGRGLSRRHLLKLAVGGAFGALASACGVPSTTTAPRKAATTTTAAATTTSTAPTTTTTAATTTSTAPTTTTTAPATTTTAPVTTTTAGPATNADWAALADRLAGRLSLPGSRGYPVDLELFDPRFDDVKPAAIAFCAGAQDVARSVDFARRHGLAVAARSGGHSYGGYSTTTGLVIDVSLMGSVSADARRGRARVGAGARLIDIYTELAAQGVAVPGGSCPTVGIAGLALGGGIGVLGRYYGLTLDHIAGLELVTADGRVMRAGPGDNADLYWACRGGGGGNFGVVTSFDLSTFPIGDLALFGSHWPWAAAADLLGAWFEWVSKAPDQLWSNCIVQTQAGSADPSIFLGGVWVGSPAGAAAQFAALSKAAGPPLSGPAIGQNSFADAMYIEAGCSGLSQAACHLAGKSPGGTLSRDVSIAKSDILTEPLSDAGIQALLAGIAERQPEGQPGGVNIDSWGGAINRVAPAATAFVHRNALASLQYGANWGPSAPAGVVRSGQAWMERWYAAMRPYVSGQAYQNYIDPRLRNWEKAYYGANLARLRSVKARWDPDNLWHFAQSIPLPS